MKKINFIFAQNRLFMKISDIKKIGAIALTIFFLGSCAQDESTSTGWKYNKTENGGFEKKDFEEQETGPGLVMIEGGVFTMGRSEEDVMDDWNAQASKKTVSSFYMDRTEVSNFHWLEYVYWMKRVYYKSYPHIYKKSLPDTLVWRNPLSYREKFIDYYFRHPAYRDYPVVGVSWIQANDFCKWRTDRVNEAILVREGILNWHFADGELNEVASANDPKYAGKFRSAPENMFNTDSYLAGQYNQTTKDGYTVTTDPKGEFKDKNKKDVPRDPYMLDNYDPVYAVKDDPADPKSAVYRGKRQVRIEDGILLPKYRLPIEAEWEFAASGLLGNLDPNSENIDERRIYPWDGHYVRKDEEQFQGSIQANFTRGRGDQMGVSGALNDGADVTCRVDDFWPNDYGLYNMAGNVSEWVMDTYRPLSSEVTDEFMPFRGNVYQTKLLVPDGLYDKQVKASENIYDVYGMKEFVNEYARVKYLAMTNNPLDLSTKFQNNYAAQQAANTKKAIDFTTASFAYIIGDTVTLTADTVLLKQSKLPINWVIQNGTFVGGTTKSDPIVKVIINTVGTFTVKLTQGPISEEKTNFITIVKTAQELKGFVNTVSSQTKINSNQDKRKYQFNSPSNSYLANSSQYTLNDSIQFAVLDDINALLDTAIFLFNKGNTIKASAYIEQALFGNANNSVTPLDFRSNYTNEMLEEEEIWNKCGVLYLTNDDEKTPDVTSVFNNLYLNYRFQDYAKDPTISTWLLTLRNGLSEFIVESRGKQRWRNVTEEENIGRLNYRKDDYIDYLDGDLESSIFYNDKQRKEDINSGKRDASQVVYQNEHENFDLEGKSINKGINGWPTTLISDKSKVYKGGSWADRAYWLSSGNRRFLDEDKSSAMIGFRCAMDRVGSSRQSINEKKRK
jgi:gliding motility-associated lipoprotein GldJ